MFIIRCALRTSANTATGIFPDAAAETAADTNAALIQLANESAEPDVAEPEAPAATETPTEDESTKPETGKEDATIEGNGDGNGQVPPGQHEDEDGNIVINGGNMMLQYVLWQTRQRQFYA